MSIESLVESAVDVGADVVVDTASSSFGDVLLAGAENATAYLDEAVVGIGEQVGSFAGSGSFWNTFNPGNIYDNITASITDFFNPNPGIALTREILNSANPLSSATAAATGLASSQTFDIGALIKAANPLGSATGLVSNQTFDIGALIKAANAVGPQVVSSLFGGGQTGSLAAAVFRQGVATASGNTRVADNSYYGGATAEEYNAINYSIQQQQIDNALGSVTQAQKNVDSQQRTLAGATESLQQAQDALNNYDRELQSGGLSPEEIAAITQQRDAAAVQLAEAKYQVETATADLESAQGQLYTANAQYLQTTETALVQPISPSQDPAAGTRTATGTNQIGPFSLNQTVNAVKAALGTTPVQFVEQLQRSAQNVVSDVAQLPGVVAAEIGNTISRALGVSPGTDAYAAAVQAVAQNFAAQGVSPEVLAALVRTGQGGADQALLNQARQVATLRQQQQNPAQSGDWRVRLRLGPLSNYLYNAPAPGILQPLKITDGVIFPYTPRIDTAYRADYETYALTHSNYRGLFYKSSYVDAINISALFTAQDTQEANYLLAVIHFFRSATKMFYGQDAQRGAPPPLVFLSGLGQFQFNEHPCVISSFQYNLPSDVDYVRAYSAFPNGTNLLSQRNRFQGVASNPLSYALQRLASVGLTKGAQPDRVPPPTLGVNDPNYVPTKIDIQLTLLPVQSRSQVSQQFSLQNFANGNLLKGGFW